MTVTLTCIRIFKLNCTMVFILKFNSLYKFHKKELLKNVITSKVMSLAFMSTEDSSETLPLPEIQRLSNSKLKKNVKKLCVPTPYTCESVLAGNPQPVDRRDLLRHDVIQKWEQKTTVNLKNNSTILLGITMLGEINKN